MTEFLSAYIPTILQILLFLVMFGMGMTLTIPDFTRVGIAPKAVFTGLVNQIVLVPLIAYGIVLLIPMEPMIAMGLMVCACSPGGAVSNLFSYLSKGDTALSITLTAISSIITIFTIPLIINFSLDAILGEASKSIQLPLGKTIFNIFKLTALPVFLGMFINYKFPATAEKSKPAIKWGSITVIVLALIFMVLKLEEIGDSWSFLKATFLSVVLLNFFTLGIGFFSAKSLKLSTKQSATISIESGMQNNVLGMTLAMSPGLLNSPEMAATPGVYGVVMSVFAIGVIYIYKTMIVKEEKA
ncbi:bile acid:sodium symporter family protein [Maribacter algarum]|uniref:Bile acid:sodium symporter family protein n=1 Tax=Maribacter algarum (ex Zhang et al. 2020) TaxID=2578118 RepID=A0A5S3PUH0_9FLAO|nr:bile acid:sodium symporter family protein [Maribacter algarum]TMM58656.1 bile acid:sodium symporter family protein [Maribacter algarum]